MYKLFCLEINLKFSELHFIFHSMINLSVGSDPQKSFKNKF